MGSDVVGEILQETTPHQQYLERYKLALLQDLASYMGQSRSNNFKPLNKNHYLRHQITELTRSMDFVEISQ